MPRGVIYLLAWSQRVNVQVRIHHFASASFEILKKESSQVYTASENLDSEALLKTVTAMHCKDLALLNFLRHAQSSYAVYFV